MTVARLFFCALFLAVFSLKAEVYLLKTRPVSLKNISLHQLPGIQEKPLYRKTVEINGMPLQLRFYASRAPYPEITEFLRRCHPGDIASGESGTVRLRLQPTGGPEERVLVIGSGPDRPVTVIALELPRKLPSPVWPQELPALPPGAVPVQITRFPEQNAVCGEFRSTSQTPQNQLRSLASRLRADNWQPGAAEYRGSIRGTGEMFVRFQPRREILLVTFQEDGSGSFFHQPQP